MEWAGSGEATPPLPYGLTTEALAAATAEPDPDSLAAATRLRSRFPPDIAAAALQQAALRRQATGKFGPAAATMFFTRTGLEQATRPAVADHHAARLLAAGATRVVDLGCGIGSDAAAFARAGLRVLAVDLDPATVEVARANLPPEVEVRRADAQRVAAELTAEDAVFCDPSRRTEHGRTWRLEDLSPSWSLVAALLDGSRVAGVKLSPGLPHAAIPPTAEAEWVSHRGEVVEAGLWSGPSVIAGRRSALIWPDARLTVDPGATAATASLPVRPVRRFLYEPDGAVIRAGGIAVLGSRLEASLLDPHLAYLSSDQLTVTPFATAFEVTDVLPYDLKALRGWVRTAGVGSLEIKCRGVDIDPARLRQRLHLRGAHRATLIISRTPAGARAFVAHRLPLEQRRST